mmetsp:Transcript_9640/g.22518  ORF Transcript_9640/g.22518 Transcript_9640/m.22518 type:complete len:277 (+) Transcript_9640:46-876(+)
MGGRCVQDLRILCGHRRRDPRSRLRLQAANRLLRGPPRRGPAGAADRAHPPRRARRAGHPRRQARRHRLHRRAVRARGLRALSRRCGDAVALHGPGLGRALPRLRGQGRHPAVPHLQQGRRRLADAAPGRCARPAAPVRASGAPRRDAVEPQRPARPGRWRHLPCRDRSCARTRAHAAPARAGRGRPGRRRGGGRAGGGPQRAPDRQLLARHPLRQPRGRLCRACTHRGRGHAGRAGLRWRAPARTSAAWSATRSRPSSSAPAWPPACAGTRRASS